MFDSKNLGKNLKQARKNAGISQQALALTVGCADASSISRFETGRRVPDLYLLASIASALKTTVPALCDSNYSTLDTPQIGELQVTMEKLLSAQKEIQHELNAIRSEMEKLRITNQ